MHLAIIQRIMGQFLMLFSITLLPPVVIDLLYQEHAAHAFFYSYLFLLSIGFLLFLPVRNHRNDLRLRDGFVVVVLFWLVLGIAGACWIAIRFGIGQLPAGTRFVQIVGVSFLAGIGFTMSIFIAELGFAHQPELLIMAKTGILFASLIAGVTGFIWLFIAGSKNS